MRSPLEALKERVGRASANDEAAISLMHFAREMGVLGDIIGRDFTIRDCAGNVLYRVRQEPLTSIQLNESLRCFHELLKEEAKQMKKSTRRR